jgi:hypothetical protein
MYYSFSKNWEGLMIEELRSLMLVTDQSLAEAPKFIHDSFNKILRYNSSQSASR